MVNKQINFLREQPNGADLTNVIALRGEILDKQPDSLIVQKADVLQGKLLKLPFVKGISRVGTYPGDGYDNLSSTVGISFPDGIKRPQQMFYLYGAQPSYFELLDLEMIAGKPFSTSVKDNDGIVINATFAHTMGFQNEQEIIGKMVKFWGKSWNITGVRVEDYHHFGLKEKIAPLLIGPQNRMDNILVKIEDPSNSIAGLDNNLEAIRFEMERGLPSKYSRLYVCRSKI